MLNLGNRLKLAREALGISQAAMAEKVGSKLRSWQGYERSEQIPGSQVISKLVELGFNANWLLLGLGDMRGDQASPGPVDGKLLGRLSEEVDRIYREENQRLGRGQAVEVAAGIYGELVGIADEAERRGAMTYALGQLRRTLRDAAAAPAQAKRSD